MKSCKKIHLSVVVDIVDIVDNNITLESGNLWLMIGNITLEYYHGLTTSADCLNWLGITLTLKENYISAVASCQGWEITIKISSVAEDFIVFSGF